VPPTVMQSAEHRRHFEKHLEGWIRRSRSGMEITCLQRLLWVSDAAVSTNA
jgi:hypothetical protein